MIDHIHLCLSIPPKYSVAMIIGVPERKKCDKNSQRTIREEKRIYESPSPGKRILRKYSRDG